MLEKILNSSQDCEKLGRYISQKIRRGDVISLEGELGSGKTTFVKGILKGLNYTHDVTSPTFTLVNEYDADIKVIHIDFYREMLISIAFSTEIDICRRRHRCPHCCLRNRVHCGSQFPFPRFLYVFL